MILLAQLKFRKGLSPAERAGLKYRMWLYPVRLYTKGVPALKDVVGLPFCDIGFAVKGEHLIVVARCTCW